MKILYVCLSVFLKADSYSFNFNRKPNDNWSNALPLSTRDLAAEMNLYY